MGACGHVQLGPGKVGLGLVTAVSTEAGLDTHIVGKGTSRVRPGRKLEVRVLGLAGREEFDPLPVASISCADCWDDLHWDCMTAIMHSPSLLITTSLTTKGLAARHGFILDLARHRAASSYATSTIFIAAENDPGPSYPELSLELERLGVECRRTVVNRFCVHADYDEKRNAHVVTVDDLAEWVIEGPATSGTPLEALAKVPYVSFVPDIDPVATRKRWLVNGLHLALAIIAQQKPIPTIDVAIAEPGRTEWAIALLQTLIESFEYRYPEMSGSLEYATAHLPVWLRHTDPVRRILSRLSRIDPLPFLDDFDRKLGDPVRLHPTMNGAQTPQVRTAFDALQRVLERPTLYVDHADLLHGLRRVPITTDIETARRYRLLLRDIFSPEEIERRVTKLIWAYAQHRDVYQ